MKLNHTRAVWLMVACTLMWSIAGVCTRHLETARSFEVTFWRSFFAALFVAAVMWQQQGRSQLLEVFKFRDAQTGSVNAPKLISAGMWAVMFTCFMLALTLTTVSNTLVLLSATPLLTAGLARVLLSEPIAFKTWVAIVLAGGGMAYMFANGVSADSGKHVLGMVVAAGVPMAAAINIITLKKFSAQLATSKLDLIPSVMLGGIISAVGTFFLAWPFSARAHDLGILALLGVVQLGLPCMLMVRASKYLSAPEVSLLALLEILFGVAWAWLFVGEAPAHATVVGGAIVLLALVLNEISVAQLRKNKQN